MHPLTAEWVAKAEADFATARRESRIRIMPNYDAACFYAQQCVEKYLKALLQEAGNVIPHTHDLIALLNLIEPPYADLTALLGELSLLSAFGVAVRYPGANADRAMARQAVAHARAVRAIVRQHLGLTAA
ncbi:MAG: HEPN domain-containing protein [Candidatus Viridilinea halotolerans]|uniref:HEPN domain-containing protein n=1 Tax=Candidatus Viridilinea halotolerans TaxID=2491704 RepID=A0A426TTE6_9CHLR|nr:MAG: HEPN domain-containing protein [Candidatus Viridilinea halotolerans]